MVVFFTGVQHLRPRRCAPPLLFRLSLLLFLLPGMVAPNIVSFFSFFLPGSARRVLDRSGAWATAWSPAQSGRGRVVRLRIGVVSGIE